MAIVVCACVITGFSIYAGVRGHLIRSGII